ncbi:hypothetical protein MPSEU_000433000 [Mayamaea pseudoterrestris]|nr:hypothetical protein MPSEU_000433000 [Mayamaea pseudoterrestris]
MVRLIASPNGLSQGPIAAISDLSGQNTKSIARKDIGMGKDQNLERQNMSDVGLVDDDHAERLKKLEQTIRSLQAGAYSSYRSCRWRAGDIYSSDDSCPDRASRILYYNLHSESRILCNHTIAPNSHVMLEQPCLEPSRLFPVIPDVTAQGLPPVKTCFDKCERDRTAKPFEQCDIPCMQSGTTGAVISRRYIDGTDWVINFSMEGPQYYPDMRVKKDAYRNNKFYSTTSYDSEIPLPYFSWAEYDIQSPPLKYEDAIKGAVFLARNCNSLNKREAIIKKMEESTFRVDSLSSCLRNAKPPDGVNLNNKVQVMRRYLFYLAFENQNEPDYITEKLWGPLVAGTVPVYFGAPNVKDHAPNRSMIAVSDFFSVADLAAYLSKVANDKALYESYQAWRSQPLPPHFHARYDFTRVHSTCRTCRWAHARLYGLGWNHSNQSLTELHVPRKVCFDEHGLVSKPFQEEWFTAGAPLMTKTSGAGSCEKLPWSGSSLSFQSNQLTRVVYEQDGVIDYLVESRDATSDNYMLRLQMPLKLNSTFDLVRDGHVRLQDQETRLTILARPRKVDIVSTQEGTAELTIQPANLPLRIRIIVEDVDKLHDNAHLEENYFGQRMIDDFYQPVEGFIMV